MTLDEANMALRLFGMKLDRDIIRDKEVYEIMTDPVNSYTYHLTTPHKIIPLGVWDLPIQEIYEHVVEHYT